MRISRELSFNLGFCHIVSLLAFRVYLDASQVLDILLTRKCLRTYYVLS